MHRGKQRGLSIFAFLALLGIAIAAGVWWQHSKDVKRKEIAAAEQAAEQAIREKEAQQQKVKAEQEAFATKVVEERSKAEFTKAIEALQRIYARWQDAVKLADTTARINLSGPVGNLQSIKREAEALLVPECFIGPKEKMVEGMAKINDGFMQFMADANLGKLLAKVRFEEGAKLISEYEQTARACSPENG